MIITRSFMPSEDITLVPLCTNILHIVQGNGNSIEKEYGEGLDSELPPDYMMPDSEVSVGGLTALRGGTNTCLVGPQVQHTSGTPPRTTKGSQVCSPEADLSFWLLIPFSLVRAASCEPFCSRFHFLPLSCLPCVKKNKS